jgi:hypothetical protein
MPSRHKLNLEMLPQEDIGPLSLLIQDVVIWGIRMESYNLGYFLFPALVYISAYTSK